MKQANRLTVAVADASAIIRSGIAAVFQRFEELEVHTVEVPTLEVLHHVLRSHEIDLVVVNPNFGGWLNVGRLREEYPQSDVKYVVIVSHIGDSSLLQEYDGSLTLYDSMEELENKLKEQMCVEEEEPEGGQQALSQREKEIVCGVVRGLTNKEIAEQLFLSVHTVITHRRNISKKLDIHSPAGLTIYAIVNKLVDIKEVHI